MQWYYASNGQRQGPVSEAGFQRLVADGTIRSDTLVWRQGMAEWQPYSSVMATATTAETLAAAAVPGTGDETEVCAVSGKRYPRREMVQYEGKWISAEHRDAFFQQLREGVPLTTDDAVPGPYGYAGFWRRFLARFVDGIILQVVGMVVGFFAGMIGAMTGGINNQMAFQGILIGIGILINVTYEVIFVRKFDATPGKMALGVKILRSDGDKLSVLRIIGRYFATFLSALPLAIGYIMAAFDDEKRSLHDRICDTRVIKTRE